MSISRLGLVGRVVLALLAVFAIGAMAASAAMATEEAPYWKVNGNRLNEGEKKEITAKLDGEAITLEGEAKIGESLIKVTITCHGVRLKAGSVIVGSKKGQPGTSEETVEFYEKCEQKGNGLSSCKVKEPIVTEPVKNELVLNDAEGGAGEKEHILVEFAPVAGEKEKFVKLEFTGAGCGVKETVVGNGVVIGSVYTDPEADGGTLELVTLGVTPELTSYLIKFPDEPKSIWLALSNGELTLVKPKEFEAFEHPAKLTGTVLVSLTSGEKYSVGGEK